MSRAPAAGTPRAGSERLPDAGDRAAELTFALEVAVRAGELQMDRYERVERVDLKSPKDVVTEVDHLSEALIVDAIRATFPDDAVLSEEMGGRDARAGHAPTSGVGRAWVVDPLDGTINYANGIPFFCVSIALVEAGRPVVGVVHDPSRNETFAAAVGGRARLNGVEISPSAKDRLSDLVVSMSLSGRSVTSRARAGRRAIRVSRSMGSAALALAYVANGRFDAMVQQGGLSTWDIAAAGLVAEAAGALVTDLAGGPWFDVSRGPKTMGLLAAPSRHHAELLRLVAGG